MDNSLDYGDIKFFVSEKDHDRIEKKKCICINMFGYENGLVYPVHVLDEKFEDCTDLLLITDVNKSHYVYIKDFNRFKKHKNKTLL